MENRKNAVKSLMDAILVMAKDDGNSIPKSTFMKFLESTREHFPESNERLATVLQDYFSRQREMDRLRDYKPAEEIDMTRLFSDNQYNPYPVKKEEQATAPAKRAEREEKAEKESKPQAAKSAKKEPGNYSAFTDANELMEAFDSDIVALREYIGTVLNKDYRRQNLLKLWEIYSDNVDKFEAYEALKSN